MNHNIDIMLRTLNCQIKEVDAIYYKIATSFKLSESAFWILYTLADMSQGCSQQELSKQLSVSRQTINSAIQSLEQKGYIFLERLPIPSRRKNVRMTDRGKSFVKQYIEPLQDAEREAFLKMESSAQEQYVSLAQTYTFNLQREMAKFLQSYKNG